MVYPGHIKFWKKKGMGIEFVKHFRSHLGPICGLAVSFTNIFQELMELVVLSNTVYLVGGIERCAFEFGFVEGADI